MLQLFTPRDYLVYLRNAVGGARREVVVPLDPSTDGHARPGETSEILVDRPDLVRVDGVADEGIARDHLHSLREAVVETGIWWYTDYQPTTPATTYATADAGDRLGLGP